MQDWGISVLFEGRNFIRLLEGLGVTLEISLLSVLVSMILGTEIMTWYFIAVTPIGWALILIRATQNFIQDTQKFIKIDVTRINVCGFGLILPKP